MYIYYTNYYVKVIQSMADGSFHFKNNIGILHSITSKGQDSTETSWKKCNSKPSVRIELTTLQI